MVKKREKASKDTLALPEKKEDLPKEKEEKLLSLIDKSEEEEKRLARLKVAETGEIPDARTFRLMYLEKCMIEAALQIQVRKNAYETRIQALKEELSNVFRQWEGVQKSSARKIADLRREIEEDYGIFLNQWGYDDETGTLQRIPQEENPPVDDKEDRGKLREDSKEVASEKKKEAG